MARDGQHAGMQRALRPDLGGRIWGALPGTLLGMVVVGASLLPSVGAPAAAGAEDVRATSLVNVTDRAASTLLQAPDRTIVTDENGAWIATFTHGARTVTMLGPVRTFAEPGVAAAVRSTTWVRLLSAPFDGEVDRRWLDAALADRSPDVLAVAMQYVRGSPVLWSPEGVRLAGDAHYGPRGPGGGRTEGADFNDYLGVRWTYPHRIDHPEAHQFESVDCSGFVRMVFGFRGGLPLSITPSPGALPRRAYQVLAEGPGVISIAHTGSRPGSLIGLAPGDLVFFDASSDDGRRVDHVGIYLGRDDRGANRFISSRKSIDGPTLGDHRGRSVLGGDGLYATAFRAARRL